MARHECERTAVEPHAFLHMHMRFSHVSIALRVYTRISAVYVHELVFFYTRSCFIILEATLVYLLQPRAPPRPPRIRVLVSHTSCHLTVSGLVIYVGVRARASAIRFCRFSFTAVCAHVGVVFLLPVLAFSHLLSGPHRGCCIPRLAIFV